MHGKIAIETYGCTLNRADSSIMASLLAEKGYDVSLGNDGSPDFVIVNTCTVKAPTAQKILERLKRMGTLGSRLIVAGCMASANQDEIEKVVPNASIITTSNIGRIADAIAEAAGGRRAVFNSYSRSDKLSYAANYKENAIARIPISEGCLSSCSFCETRFARGPLNSFSEELILKAVRMSLEKGAKEIELTSQDAGAYGRERGTNIAELAAKVAEIDDIFRARIGMLNPEHLGRYIDELLESYKSEKIYKFLHIPVQSGSNKVLREMNRRYSREDFISYVAEARKKIPGISIATDIIVGYPSESEDDFNETLSLIEEVKPSVTNVSKFGARPHAPASRLAQLNNRTVKERSIAASRLVRRVQFEERGKLVGSVRKMLVTEAGRSYTGRDDYYNQIALKNSSDIGSFVNAKIIGNSEGCLIGEAIA